MNKVFLLFFVSGLIFFIPSTHLAQSDSNDLPTADTWREFKLNKTTKSEVETLLGKPKKNLAKISDQSLPNDWTKSGKGKSVQLILYKELGNYNSVEFTFFEDKLVGINFQMKKNKMKGLLNKSSNLLPANKLGEIFNTDFLLFYGVPKNSVISDYEGQKETTVPKIYPQNYSVLSINKNSIILISVDNTNFKSGFKIIFNKPTVELFPGYAQRIKIFSRN